MSVWIRIARRSSALMIAVAVMAGCGFLPGFESERLHVLNSTTIPVTLVVNGREIGVVAPNTSAGFGADSLPALPWLVAARTSGGRDLVTLDVGPDAVHDDVNLNGTGSSSAPAARADLSCGQVRVFVGRLMPGGPAPGPGKPGDCEP